MYTREEGFYGLPRPLRADIQLWIHLVRTYIECNYFNFIAAIEKENFLLNKSPGTLPRLLFFVFLYPIAFYFLFSGFSCIVTFPNTNPFRLSRTTAFSSIPASLYSLASCIINFTTCRFSARSFTWLNARTYTFTVLNSCILLFRFGFVISFTCKFMTRWFRSICHCIIFAAACVSLFFMPAESICLLEK